MYIYSTGLNLFKFNSQNTYQKCLGTDSASLIKSTLSLRLNPTLRRLAGGSDMIAKVEHKTNGTYH